MSKKTSADYVREAQALLDGAEAKPTNAPRDIPRAHILALLAVATATQEGTLHD